MKGLELRSLSGETEPYSLLLLVSSTTTGTGSEMLRRYSEPHDQNTTKGFNPASFTECIKRADALQHAVAAL